MYKKKDIIDLIENKYLYYEHIDNNLKHKWNDIKKIDKYDEFLDEFCVFTNHNLDSHTKCIDIDKYKYILPIFFTIMNGNIIVISDVCCENIHIERGCILTHINGIQLDDYAKYNDMSVFSKNKTLYLLKIMENLVASSKPQKINLTFVNIRGETLCINVEYLERKKITDTKQQFDNINKVYIKHFNQDICYIKLPSLNDEKEIDNAINEIIKQGRRYNILLDIRNNMGGRITSAAKLTGIFLKYDHKIFVKNRNEIEIINIHAKKNFFKNPVGILVNNMTSSSLEYIFLKTVIGEENIIVMGNMTTGMKDIATVYKINQRFTLVLTTKKYVSCRGENLKIERIQPRIEIPVQLHDFYKFPDNQLIKAIEFMRKFKY